MHGYCALTLTAISMLVSVAAAAGPLSTEDVRLERQSIPPEVCQEKARAFAQLRVSGSDLAKWVLVSGTSTIQNKLYAADASVIIPTRETPSDQLGSEKFNFGIEVSRRNFSAHYPGNGLKNIIDAKGVPHPELFVSPTDLQTGVNLLVPFKTIQAPACLSALDLEEYIHLRLECGLKTGDYWAQLHSNKYTDEQLALLRYYDYLDANAPKQPVSVYRCTELTLLGKH
jgi:hypothetical protein